MKVSLKKCKNRELVKLYYFEQEYKPSNNKSTKSKTENNLSLNCRVTATISRNNYKQNTKTKNNRNNKMISTTIRHKKPGYNLETIIVVTTLEILK